jgi:hypothetical protein
MSHDPVDPLPTTICGPERAIRDAERLYQLDLERIRTLEAGVDVLEGKLAELIEECAGREVGTVYRGILDALHAARDGLRMAQVNAVQRICDRWRLHDRHK